MIVRCAGEAWPRTQRYLFAAGRNVIPHQIGGPNLARRQQPSSFQFLIVLLVDCATPLYVDRCMTDQATDELRRHLSQVIEILQPYALSSGPINKQNATTAIRLAAVYLS
jgi:hypothetical protein